MSNENTPLGSVRISPRAIATIASHSALQSYGVVGLASKNLVDGLTQAIVKDPKFHYIDITHFFKITFIDDINIF